MCIAPRDATGTNSIRRRSSIYRAGIFTWKSPWCRSIISSFDLCFRGWSGRYFRWNHPIGCSWQWSSCEYFSFVTFLHVYLQGASHDGEWFVFGSRMASEYDDGKCYFDRSSNVCVLSPQKNGNDSRVLPRKGERFGVFFLATEIVYPRTFCWGLVK